MQFSAMKQEGGSAGRSALCQIVLVSALLLMVGLINGSLDRSMSLTTSTSSILDMQRRVDLNIVIAPDDVWAETYNSDNTTQFKQADWYFYDKGHSLVRAGTCTKQCRLFPNPPYSAVCDGHIIDDREGSQLFFKAFWEEYEPPRYGPKLNKATNLALIGGTGMYNGITGSATITLTQTGTVVKGTATVKP